MFLYAFIDVVELKQKDFSMKTVFYVTLFLTLVFSASSYASPCSEVFLTKIKETLSKVNLTKVNFSKTDVKVDFSKADASGYKALRRKIREEIQSLTNKEIQELTLEEIKELGYKIKYLKPKKIRLFKGEQKLSVLPFGYMTPEQSRALTKKQLQDIPLKVLEDPLVSFDLVLINLTTKQIFMFKPEQLKVLNLHVYYHFGPPLTQAQRQALNKAQRQAQDALSVEEMMTPEQILHWNRNMWADLKREIKEKYFDLK